MLKPVGADARKHAGSFSMPGIGQGAPDDLRNMSLKRAVSGRCGSTADNGKTARIFSLMSWDWPFESWEAPTRVWGGCG